MSMEGTSVMSVDPLGNSGSSHSLSLTKRLFLCAVSAGTHPSPKCQLSRVPTASEASALSAIIFSK